MLSYYKIGQSINPYRRLKNIDTHSPSKPKIILLIPDPLFVKEKILHRMFSKKRARKEWFRLNQKDIKEIKYLSDFLGEMEEREKIRTCHLSRHPIIKKN